MSIELTAEQIVKNYFCETLASNGFAPLHSGDLNYQEREYIQTPQGYPIAVRYEFRDRDWIVEGHKAATLSEAFEAFRAREYQNFNERERIQLSFANL